MSTKHYFASTEANTLVPRALRALVSSNPHLTLNERDRVVAVADNSKSTVSIIGGGGSGHEPAWSGFVGEGLLSAAACGDIFASPSTKQVLSAMKLAPSTLGTVLLITNYTGDRLHFGLAAERAKAEGLTENVCVLPLTDDVSIGRTKSDRVGRRGMPGHVFTMKILCAAAASGAAYQKCVDIGQAVNSETVSIGSALDHCHVPGRNHQSIPQDVCVLGAGIHNEPGQLMLTPFPTIEDVIGRCLKLLCDDSDPERGFMKVNSGDSIMLLVNNYGGLSPLELGAIQDEVQKQLLSTYQVKPCRTLSGAFETSLNAPGFSISLCNITAAATKASISVDHMLDFFDSPTKAVSWPNVSRPACAELENTSENMDNESQAHGSWATDIIVDPMLLQRCVRSACEDAIAAEPKLTEWDMVMGDGDCGEAVKSMADSVLRLLDNGAASTGSLSVFLGYLIEAVDDMGGTLGAILGILLSAFSTELQASAKDNTISAISAGCYASALKGAVETLKSHTSAREGDRTVMDVLIPFAVEFSQSLDFSSAVKVAADKAESTRFLKARLGRATYVGERAGQELPDPGAWAFYEIVSGMAKGLGIKSA